MPDCRSAAAPDTGATGRKAAIRGNAACGRRSWRSRQSRPGAALMAMNPLAYAENVVSNFLRYQLTAYPFADPVLYAQMRELLSLQETRRTPLLQGPFISLSQAFRQGARVADLVAEGVLHPHMAIVAPYDQVYGHQELAIRAIAAGHTTLVSTGTGSGKTESFLYPIISRCLEMRDANAAPGVVAVIVYPMNAL